MSIPHTHLTTCPNCGRALGTDDAFCPSCGQPNHDLRIPFKHLVLEVIEGLLHFDSKSILTVKTLLLYPGRLTNEFVSGRRARYVPPIRLYILTSVLFFFLLALTTNQSRHGDQKANTDIAIAAGGAQTTTVHIQLKGIDAQELAGLSESQIDSLLEARGAGGSAINTFMAHQMARIGGEGTMEFTHLYIKWISYMMFVLMPVFAVFVMVLFWKRETLFIDALVFSVHYHSFAFALFSVSLIIGRIPHMSWILLLAPIMLAVYLFLALRSRFLQSRLVTALKTILVGMLHIVAMVLCFLLASIASIALF